MLRRCNDPTCRGFKWYGARGVRVCELWTRSLRAFIADVKERPSIKYQLDRINNDGNYEPGNVRWVTSKQNSRNARGRRLLSIGGRTQCVSAWVEETGAKINTVFTRLRQGHAPSDAVDPNFRPDRHGGCGQRGGPRIDVPALIVCGVRVRRRSHSAPVVTASEV
jgi:hypothetical protein